MNNLSSTGERSRLAGSAGLLGLYLATFGASAIVLTFFTVYLRARGWSGKQVSLFVALGPLFAIVGSVPWGWLADRSGSHLGTLRLALAGAFLAACPLVLPLGFGPLIACYALHLLVYVAVPGLIDAVTLGQGGAGNYARRRSWGSISFGLTAAAMGALLSYRSSSGADRLIPASVAVLFGLAGLASLFLRAPTALAVPRPRLTPALWRNGDFLALLALGFLHGVATAPYRGFLPILMQDRGVSLAMLGQLSLVAVVAEAGAFQLFERAHRLISLPRLVAVSFAVLVVRSLLTAAVDSVAGTALLQVLHGATFAVFWAAALRLLAGCVAQSQLATARMLFSALTIGVGMAAGSFASGALYDRYRDASACFVLSGLVALFALAIAGWRSTRLAFSRFPTPDQGK